MADLKDFVTSMKDGDKATKEAKVEEKPAEVFTVHLDVDNFKDQVKEGNPWINYRDWLKRGEFSGRRIPEIRRMQI